MGKWYELLHYPSRFQPSHSYNTTAEYSLNEDGTVDVLNTTFSNGEEVTAHGTAYQLAPKLFHVSFDERSMAEAEDRDTPNYIIRRIWVEEDIYQFAVVTDDDGDGLWLLSRTSSPSREDYETILAYLTHHYDAQKFIATPHYA